MRIVVLSAFLLATTWTCVLSSTQAPAKDPSVVLSVDGRIDISKNIPADTPTGTAPFSGASQGFIEYLLNRLRQRFPGRLGGGSTSGGISAILQQMFGGENENETEEGEGQLSQMSGLGSITGSGGMGVSGPNGGMLSLGSILQQFLGGEHENENEMEEGEGQSQGQDQMPGFGSNAGFPATGLSNPTAGNPAFDVMSVLGQFAGGENENEAEEAEEGQRQMQSQMFPSLGSGTGSQGMGGGLMSIIQQIMGGGESENEAEEAEENSSASTGLFGLGGGQGFSGIFSRFGNRKGLSNTGSSRRGLSRMSSSLRGGKGLSNFGSGSGLSGIFPKFGGGEGMNIFWGGQGMGGGSGLLNLVQQLTGEGEESEGTSGTMGGMGSNNGGGLSNIMSLVQRFMD